MQKVSFEAADGLLVTADEYLVDPENPYIILFHEQGSSRGEFHTVARRLCKMDYNCLAVDLRNGGNKSFVSNETAKRCRDQRCSTGISDIELDIRGAIDYAYTKNQLPVILFGSGANGSLSLKVATEHELVKAVVALSPGEYFQPGLSIQDTIAKLKKPAFISSSKPEFPYVAELASKIHGEYLSLFEPELGAGNRGTAALTAENEHNSEYWLALLLFFKDLI